MPYKKEETEKIFKEILLQISRNGLSLRKVLLQKNMPNSETFYKWIEADESKSKQYARACAERADAIFDEIIEIADTPLEGKVIETYEDGTTKENGTTKEKTGDMLGHRRLQIDARKWSLSKMNPKKYGDRKKIEMEVSEIKPIVTKRDV